MYKIKFCALKVLLNTVHTRMMVSSDVQVKISSFCASENKVDRYILVLAKSYFQCHQNINIFNVIYVI